MTDMSPDRLRALLPALSLGITTTAFIVAKTGRDALFFQGSTGVLQLPLVYINIGAASLPLAMLFVKTMKLWGARPARVGILLFAGIVMACAAPFLKPGDNVPLLAIFMFIPAVFGLVFASLWLMAADIFQKTDKREAARAFSKMGAATLAGGMAGGLMAKGLAPMLDPHWLIFIGGLTIFSVVALVRHIHRRFPGDVNGKSEPDNRKTRFLTPVKNRYVMTLLFISMTGALAGLLIDFQFYVAASSAAMGMKGNTRFFANFYILLNFSSLLLQLFATPRIQDRIGLRGGLMILPVALIGGATFATAAATALSRSVLRVTEGGLRSSVHRSIWEQAFIPLDPWERSAAKIAVDGIAARIAEALGAIALLIWLRTLSSSKGVAMPLDTSWITWTILVTVIVWLLVTQKLREQVRKDPFEYSAAAAESPEIDCVRFPDQCPCTTELGKGVA
jgi:ATP/ADP translocase